MNNLFNLPHFVRMTGLMNAERCLTRWLPTFVLAAVLIGLAGGCERQGTARVKLQVVPSANNNPTQLNIEAQIVGSQSGLHYRWFAVSGTCDPQESDSPTTQFRFADNVARDRVSVEVWRGNQRIGIADIDVRVDYKQSRDSADREVQIEITTIPPAERGGPDTRASIAGTVSGNILPGDEVLIYANWREIWYIQPLAHSVTPINPDNTWSNWTHTGSSYAALVVKHGYEPRARLDVLPRVGGSVLARTIVEGRPAEEIGKQ